MVPDSAPVTSAVLPSSLAMDLHLGGLDLLFLILFPTWTSAWKSREAANNRANMMDETALSCFLSETVFEMHKFFPF